MSKQDPVPPTKRQEAARTRVEVALASIEDAQLLLIRAAQALSSINGLEPEWRKVGTLYDRVKAAWHLLDQKAARRRAAGRLTLDHEPTEHEAHWAALAGKEWLP